MSVPSLDEARVALRVRQGAGARYDSAAAPAEALALARRGTAHFSRLLADMPDDGFRVPSAKPGWTRAMLIAHLGYHARSLATYVGARRAGMAPGAPAFADASEIALAGTLSPEALRHLFRHSSKHLDVEWRDLDEAGWGEDDLRALPEARARVIWRGSLSLGTTGRAEDLPAQFR